MTAADTQTRADTLTGADVGTGDRPRLAYFPDYHENPYQQMLYTELVRSGTPVTAVANLRRHLSLLAHENRGAGEVLHVHWTAPVLQPLAGPLEAWASLQHLVRRLDDFAERGGTLVWTVHNVLPHEVRHRTAEIALHAYLAQRADLVHVMSEATLDAVRPYYELPAERTHVVAHSSYVGVYPDEVDRATARHRLGLQEHEIVLVALGGVRPYRGLDLLLDVFEPMAARDPRLVLLVAGKPGRAARVQDWRRRCEANPQVVSSFAYVPGEELQLWLRAADVAVLPYRDILNSGAFHLATTFDLPVVAPDVGSLREHRRHEFVHLFRPDSPVSLEQAVADAVQRWGRGGRRPDPSPRDLAESRPPQAMARELADLLRPYLEVAG